MYETYWAGRGPAHYSTADLVPLRAYAHEVFAATDGYLAGLAADAASQMVDLSRLGQGQPTVAWLVSKFVVLQLARRPCVAGSVRIIGVVSCLGLE